MAIQVAFSMQGAEQNLWALSVIILDMDHIHSLLLAISMQCAEQLAMHFNAKQHMQAELYEIQLPRLQRPVTRIQHFMP